MQKHTGSADLLEEFTETASVMPVGIERQIHEIVGDFDRDPHRCSRALRALAEKHWAAFPRAAAIQATGDPGARASRFLVSLLHSLDRLIDQIASVTIAMEQAVRLGTLAIEAVPGIEHKVLEEICKPGSRLSSMQKSRAMAVISRVAEPRLIIRDLARVVEEGEPHLRSKAVLLC